MTEISVLDFLLMCCRFSVESGEIWYCPSFYFKGHFEEIGIGALLLGLR